MLRHERMIHLSRTRHRRHSHRRVVTTFDHFSDENEQITLQSNAISETIKHRKTCIHGTRSTGTGQHGMQEVRGSTPLSSMTRVISPELTRVFFFKRIADWLSQEGGINSGLAVQTGRHASGLTSKASIRATTSDNSPSETRRINWMLRAFQSTFLR